MRSLAATLFLGLLGLAAQVQCEVNIAFIEARPGTLFHAAPQAATSLDDSAFASIATALLNTGSLTELDAQQSAQISEIVKAAPFDSSEALLLLTIAGAKQDQVLSGADLTAVGTSNVLDGVAMLRHAHSIEQIQLDTSSMSGCGEACLEHLLLQANSELGLNATYSTGKSALRGKWQFRSQAGLAVVLDLIETSDRLVALEIASYWAAVKDSTSKLQTRAASASKTPQLLSRAFISAHMIKQTYGADSPQYKTVLSVFRTVIAASIQSLQAASGQRLVASVISLDSVTSEQEAGLWSLTTPSHSMIASRRKLLASEGDSDYVNSFIAWVAMWGSFFLLLFFALTGCHCLRSMKFKQDSLLYGKNKSD